MERTDNVLDHRLRQFGEMTMLLLIILLLLIFGGGFGYYGGWHEGFPSEWSIRIRRRTLGLVLIILFGCGSSCAVFEGLVMGSAGRPIAYILTIAGQDYICQELGNGRSLRAICENDDGMPDRSTVA